MKILTLSSIAFFFITLPFVARSQDDSLAFKITNEVAETYLIRESFWLNSINSSMFYQCGVRNYSKVELNYGLDKASYKRVSDPAKNAVTGFNTTGMKSYKKLHFLGTLDYNHQISKDIDWSLMMDAERDNPFMIADSIGGDWIKDRYTLGLKVCSDPMWNFIHFGINMNYAVAMGGRDNDPRPKSLVKNIRIIPSVAFKLGSRNNLGISYIYRDYMQDIDVMIKSGVGSAVFYKIMGLALKENPLTKSSYDYRIEAFEKGVSLFYATSLDGASLISEGTYTLSTEKDIYSPYASITNPQTNEVSLNPTVDVRFSEEQYDFSLGIDFKSSRMPQKISLGLSYDDGKLYNHGTSQVEYTRVRQTVSVKYTALLNASDIHKATTLTIGSNLTNEEAIQAYYASRKMKSLTAYSQVNQAFNIFGREFCAEINLRGKFNLHSDLNIHPESVFIEPETAITKPVIWSNYYYDAANWISPGIAITYYPILSKQFRTYMGLNWSGIILINNYYYGNSTHNFAQVKFGFLF